MNEEDLARLLTGLWIAEDQTRSMRIERDANGWRVSVWQRSDQRALVSNRPAWWHPPKEGAAASPFALERLGFLQVELGDIHLGTTYNLMTACRNDDPDAFGGFAWRRLPASVARADVRLFPEGGSSFYEAVLGYYDDVVEELRQADAWMQPLSTWLPVDEGQPGEGPG